MSTARSKQRIRRVLWIGGVLSLALLVAVALWRILAAVGDEDGSRVAGGVALGFLVCWGVTFVVLVVLLALRSLTTDGHAKDE